METTLYCGIDFHKHTSTLCVLNFGGEVKEQVTVLTNQLVKYLANRKHYLIGIEASGGTNDMVQRLKECGHTVKIINPNKFKGIGIGGKKTDEKDSKALAEALRLNYIPEVYHKSLNARKLKSLLMGRDQIVRMRVNLMNHVRGILREYGVTMPKGADHFYEQIRYKLEELNCPMLTGHLVFSIEEIKTLKEQEKILEKQMEEISKDDLRIQRLRTAPGIGLIIAVTFIAVMDDIQRFKDGKHFASYLGLVPREYSSGDRRRMGSITRSGSELLRRNLIHGARAVLMHTNEKSNDPNRRWALKLKDRIGMNKATVALAHRMSRIGFAMLRDNKNYGEKNEQIKKAA